MSKRAYLFDPITNEKFRVDGVIPSTELPDKPKLQQQFASHMLFSAAELPPKVDLRPDMTSVENQSTAASCVANAFAGACEYLLKKATGREIDISRLFIYYNARMKSLRAGQRLRDEGCSITRAIETLEETGNCLESIWPYDLDYVNDRPHDDAYDAASYSKINDALQLNVDLEEMKSSLAQGFPFVFGLKLFKSFNQASKKGFVPMPHKGDQARETHKNHAMLAVGYSDQSKAFIIRNSWGSQWGDQGYCYIPYDYVANPDYCFEPWVVRQLDTDDMGHENWDVADSVNYHPNDDNEEGEDDGLFEEEDYDEEDEQGDDEDVEE